MKIWGNQKETYSQFMLYNKFVTTSNLQTFLQFVCYLSPSLKIVKKLASPIRVALRAFGLPTQKLNQFLLFVAKALQA